MQKTKRVKSPRKQRKRYFNSPAHIRHKLMSAPLSKELAASRGVRSLPVRKGDTVRIMRGDNKGFEGKVSRVAMNEYRIYMEGLTREKVDGTNIFLPIHPSKVQIRNLNLEDNWRKDILARKKAIEKPEMEEKPKAVAEKKAEEAPEQPQKKIEEVEEEKPVEEIATETAKEEAPATEMAPEEVAVAPEKAPAPRKTRAKKPAAKKEATPKKKVPAEKEAAPVEEEKPPAKKTAKPKTTAKKTAKPKEAPAKKAATKKTGAKPRAKRKASEEAEGGQ